MKRILSRTIVVLFLFCTASAQNDWQLLRLEEYAVEYVYAKGDTIWASILDTN